MIVSRQLRRSIKSFMKRKGAKSPHDQLTIVRALVNAGISGPYDGKELELAQSVGRTANGPFYHGGPSGLSEIRPAGETGNRRVASDVVKVDNYVGRFALDRLRWAFFSTSIEEARIYARQRTNGVVYRVEPRGDILADMEYLRPVYILSEIPGTAFHAHRGQLDTPEHIRLLARWVTSYCAASAKVVRVVPHE